MKKSPQNFIIGKMLLCYIHCRIKGPDCRQNFNLKRKKMMTTPLYLELLSNNLKNSGLYT